MNTFGKLADNNPDLLVHYAFENNLNEIAGSGTTGRPYNLTNINFQEGSLEVSNMPKAVAMASLFILTTQLDIWKKHRFQFWEYSNFKFKKFYRFNVGKTGWSPEQLTVCTFNPKYIIR